MAENGCRKNADDFASLYSKYWAGKKWLDAREAAGHDTKKDMDEFCEKVIYPLCLIWNALSAGEKEHLKAVMRAYEGLKGTQMELIPEAPRRIVA